ncbi:MAG: cell envelope integrity protein TolA, partial [Pseudomonadota bacterium]
TAVEAAGLALGALNTAESKLQRAINAVQTAVNNATEFLMAIPGLAQLLAAADGAIDGFLAQLSPSLRNAYNTAKTAQAAAQIAVDNAQRELDRARRDRDALIEDVAVAAGDLDLKRAAFEMLDGLRNGAWATADAAFGGWVANIEAAVDAYVLAFEETGRRIMQPQKTRFQQQQGNLEPVRRWAACWGPAFGLPLIPQLHSSCDLSLARYNDLRAAATALKNNLLVPEQFPALRALVLAYDEAVQEATADGLALVGGMVGRAVPTAAGGDIGSGVVAFASTMWDHDVQPADLEQLYSEDGSRVGLPRFSSGQLLTVLSEDGLPMRWQTDGRSGRQRLDAHAASFDEMMQFKPFANAVNLSKLALLGGAELNRLATERRRNAPGYLPNRSYRRFYHPNEQAGAILLGAIRSIDGNHQWQAIAPELPQAASNLSKRSTSTTCQRFGYRPGGQGYPSPAQLAAIVDPDDGVPYCEKDDSGFAAERTELPARKRGMHFWNDPMLRRTIFNCVFKGPLSDGICGVLDNEQALLRHGCSGEPFPPSLGSVSTAGPYCLLQPVAMSKQPPRIPMSGEKTSQTTRPVERRTDQVGKSRPAATGTGSSRDSRKAAAVDRKAAAPRSQQKSSRQAGPAAKSQRERLQDSGRPAAEQQDREARQRATERQVKTLAAEAQAAEAKPAGEHTTTVKTTAGEAPAAERVEQKPAAEEAIRKQPAADAAARRKQEALRDPRIKSGTPGGRPPRD